MIRQRVLYAGEVQGVGFRHTVRTLAQRFAVAGYVQNLPDGRVRLEAQGTADEVQALLDKVASRLAHRITSCETTDLPLDETLGDAQGHGAFTVRY